MSEKKFNGKTYKAWGEYYGKREAQKAAKKLRESGYYARITPGSYIGSYTVWRRKRR